MRRKMKSPFSGHPEAFEGQPDEPDKTLNEIREIMGHKGLPSEEEECPHDEHDHGICLECGKDIFDDLVGEADFRRDAARDAWADRQGQ